MFFIRQLSYDEITDTIDKNNIVAMATGYTLLPGLFESSDFSLVLKSLLPDEVKVNFIIDDNRLRSNLTTDETIKFTKNFFLYHIRLFSTPFRSSRKNLGICSKDTGMR